MGKEILRILRQTAESESFRWIVEPRHLTEAADEIERLLALVARHADPEGKTPSAIHAAMMAMELAVGNSQKTVFHFDATKPEWETDD